MTLPRGLCVNSAGHLEIAGCDTVDIAQQYGTPLYVMNEDLIREHCREYQQGFGGRYPRWRVLYASKAFLTTAICRLIEAEGLGLDVVSGGELYTALAAHFPPELIYFHGNNKTPDEIEMALRAGVGRFMVDSDYELELLNAIASRLGRTASVILRVTPGIEAHTHDYVQTGQLDSKFGISLAEDQIMMTVRQALALPHIGLKGLHCHIGSQIFELAPYRLAAEVMVELLHRIQREFGIALAELDLGGGVGIQYTDEDHPLTRGAFVETVIDAVTKACERHDFPLPELLIEPGRSLVGDAGITLYSVGSIKDVPSIRRYVAVDGGMVDNPRPALYGARYEAVVANKADQPRSERISLAGRCCESGDMLIKDITLAPVESGDLIAVFATGAYNYSMASNYNRLPRPAVVMVTEGQAHVVVRRESYSDLIANDIIPAHLRRVPEAANSND
ncbi:MAG: diaminopimelate decarboxylase [Bacillota bacterium]